MPKVLVVDDDRARQVLLNVLLTRAGFDCEFVSDGRQALKRLDGDGNGKYAVIMLDLILPEISGIEILQQLEQKHPGMLPRTIVLTSASEGVLGRVDPFRIHSVIRKPFDIQHVIQQTAACAYQD